MILYFLRHANAGERLATPKKDEKRALDKDGQVDLIVSSPLKRSTQTAVLVANEMGHEGKLITDPALRPDANFSDFRKLVDKHAKLEAMMVVGHNPNLSEFLGRVISDNGSESSVDLKKGAVAKVEMYRNSGSMQWCLTPRLLRTLYKAATESSRPKTSRK